MSDSPAPPVPPPRNVTQAVPTQVIPPMYAPNSAVPKFIRLLAILVFLVGGTTATLITYIYKVQPSSPRALNAEADAVEQNFVFPKLLQTLEARTELHQTQGKLYGRLLGGVARLCGGTGGELIAPHLGVRAKDVLKRLEEEEPVQKEGEVEDKKVVDAVEVEKVVKEEKVEEKSTTKDPTIDETSPPPVPQLYTSLIASLQTITSIIPPPPSPTPLLQSPNTPQTSALALTASLKTLTDYIESETFASASSAYRSYGATFGNTPPPSGGGKEMKGLYEVVAGFKSEIRAVKGALLNRRNFTQRAGVEVA